MQYAIQLIKCNHWYDKTSGKIRCLITDDTCLICQVRIPWSVLRVSNCTSNFTFRRQRPTDCVKKSDKLIQIGWSESARLRWEGKYRYCFKSAPSKIILRWQRMCGILPVSLVTLACLYTACLLNVFVYWCVWHGCAGGVGMRLSITTTLAVGRAGSQVHTARHQSANLFDVQKQWQM